MSLLPTMNQMIPDLVRLLELDSQEQVHSSECLKAQSLMIEELSLHNPKDFDNKEMMTKFKVAMDLLTRQLENPDLKDEEKESLEINLCLCKGLMVSRLFYQGNWSQAISTIKEALAIASDLVKQKLG